jgi:hypothetical protein
MAPLQKEIYRGILRMHSTSIFGIKSHLTTGGNLDILRSLNQANQATNAKSQQTSKTNMNNILMQLRKCVSRAPLFRTPA